MYDQKNHEFSQPLLIDVLSTILNTSEIQVDLIPTGKFNTSFFISANGQKFVLRIAPEECRSQMLFYEHRMILQEPTILKKVSSETKIPVPEVISLTERDPQLKRDWILQTCLPGAPMIHHALKSDKIASVHNQLGHALQSLHNVKGDKFGYLGEHRPMEPQISWPQAFQVMWNQLVEDIRSCNGYDSEEAESMKRLCESFYDAIPEIDHASLLHMDIWQENILVTVSEGLTGIIDWDRALWGDPLLDLVIADYCGMVNNDFSKSYFSPLQSLDPHSRLYKIYLLYEIQKYIFIEKVRRKNPAASTNYKIQCLNIARSMFD